MRDGRVVQIGTPEELILHPADDYVAQFTGEVPRIKILRAGQCAEALANRPEGLPQVDPEARVEGLMPLLAANPKGVDVVEGGTYVGTLTAASLVAALAASEGAQAREVAHG